MLYFVSYNTIYLIQLNLLILFNLMQLIDCGTAPGYLVIIIIDKTKDSICIIISVQLLCYVKLNINPLRLEKLIIYLHLGLSNINLYFNCFGSLVWQNKFSKANTQLVIQYLNQIQKLRWIIITIYRHI